jgi:chemotaxis protein MotB
VLVDLVQGLTSDTARARSEQGAEPGLGSAHASLAALDADLRVLVTSVRHSQEDIAAMQAQRGALEAELTRAKSAVEVARGEQAKDHARAEAFRAMREQLAPLIADGSLQVRVVDQRMVLALPPAMLFARDDARVLPSGKALLDRVAEVLNRVEGREFQVAGHTDAQPMRGKRYPDKWRLSGERALNVMLYLAERGVPKGRLSSSAYADTRPLVAAGADANADPSRNNRIEIVLLPTADELPDLSHLEAPAP